jgi:hypothetical protein
MNGREIGHLHYIAESLTIREIGMSHRREEWYISGALALRDLFRKRYGPKSVNHELEAILDWTGHEAIRRRGDRALARRRYWAAAMLNLRSFKT